MKVKFLGGPLDGGEGNFDNLILEYKTTLPIGGHKMNTHIYILQYFGQTCFYRHCGLEISNALQMFSRTLNKT